MIGSASLRIYSAAILAPHRLFTAPHELTAALSFSRSLLQTEKIKESLEEKEGIPPAQQRLIFLGKAM